MSNVAISVEGLGKRYSIGTGPKEPYGSLRDSLTRAGKAPLNRLRRRGQSDSAERDYWALKDVSFEVKHGEAVGIIGRNGAGKSTLLKVLSRITEPTTGQAIVNGRVGSLLEVGTGFHPELTGRENIYLNGAVMGMSRVDIQRRFDEIVDFSGVETYLDTPVKRYSSGMYMRLAFAVAAHLEPEVLVVDEVLAVGDFEFQKKCLGKMQDVAESGRTVLFVSHNLAAMLALCTQGILLDNGFIMQTGPIGSAIERYLTQNSLGDGVVDFPATATDSPPDLRFSRVTVSMSDKEPNGRLRRDAPVIVTITYKVFRDLRSCQIGFELWNAQGICILTSSNLDVDTDHTFNTLKPGIYNAQCRIPSNLLREGHYSLTLGASIPHVCELDRRTAAISFEVADYTSGEARIQQHRNGIIMPYLPWSTSQVVGDTVDDVA